MKTVSSLEKKGVLPATLVYCTSAKVGNALDELKRDLRRDKHLALEVHDFAWLNQRELTTSDRAALSDRYATEILAPIQRGVDPSVLYSGVLSDEQERLAFQFLEAQKLDRKGGGNLTKRVFEALIVCVLRQTPELGTSYSLDYVTTSIAHLFHEALRPRVIEIVNARVESLRDKGVLQFNKDAGAFALSTEKREAFLQRLSAAKDRDAIFRARLIRAIDDTATEREIDYSFDRNVLASICHSCVLWHMKAQADRFVDPYTSVAQIIYADRLLDAFVKNNPLRGAAKALKDAVADVLPHVLYTVLNSRDNEVQAYLRDKADLFIMQAFLQVTPDVYEACRNLVGQDTVYLDTSALIRCVAELYSEAGHGPLTAALRCARALNTRLCVWKSHIDELVTHLRGPVLLEWENHLSALNESEIEPYLWTAPTLLKVFADASRRRHRGFRQLVEEIIGRANEWENTKEYLIQELGIVVENTPAQEDNAWWSNVFGVWLANKRKSPRLSEERFDLLVRNDVNAFCAVVQMRRKLPVRGTNYGQKVWLLTFDNMFWRVPKLLEHASDHVYQIGMSMDYLINYVATAAQAGILELPDEVLPATAIIDETESGATELREIVVERWNQPGERKYMRERRLRDLVHELKSSRPESRLDDIEIASALDADEGV